MACTATNQRGEDCQATEIRGEGWCFWHHPDRARERTEARRKGGLSLHYGMDHRPEPPEVRIREVKDVLALIETAAADLLARNPSVHRARALTYVAVAALKAVEVGALEERIEALERRSKPLRAS